MKSLKQLLSEYKQNSPTVEPNLPQIKLNSNQIFVIDAMNLFIRNFSVSTILDKRGHHIGGLVGSLNSLYSLVRKFRPSQIIIVFEGDNATDRRKKLYKDYKANRKGKGKTNKKVFFNDDEAEASFNNQLIQFIQYLQNMPITLLSVEEYEADDIIGWLVTKSCLKLQQIETNLQQIDSNSDTKFTIVSTDADYLQLVNENVTVYSPIKKIMYQVDTVFEEFGIYPHNFLLYKTLIGDKSDNILGVKGLQLKTLLKTMPDMSKLEQILLEDVLQICENKMLDKKCYKIYNEIHLSQDLIHLNKKLMNLCDVNIPKIVEREINANLLDNLELNLSNLVSYSMKQFLDVELFKLPQEFFTEFNYLTK
jgi:DNA polymerase I